MNSLIAAALVFVGIHLLISGTRLRDALVARLGERVYLGLFSLLSVAAFTWLIVAFGRIRVPIPTALDDWRWLAWVLNLVAFVFIGFGVLTRSPTTVAGETLVKNGATGMQRITRHPMLWGIALWAAVHIVFNPEPATSAFFGALLALALFGPWSIDAKRARALGTDWQRYLEQTSNVPFLAILQGRNRFAPGELLDWRLAVSVAIYLVFLFLHARMFGVPAL